MIVYITKPDLDTCLTAMILGITNTDQIIILDEAASDSVLADPETICIESGGSGLVQLNNFDHHDPFTYHPPACRQAFEKLKNDNQTLERMVAYVSLVDEAQPVSSKIPFPSLAAIFSGMCLCHNNSLDQFFTGIKLLKAVLDNGIDPFSRMPLFLEWAHYCEAKSVNQQKLLKLAKSSSLEFHQTGSGLRLGYLAHCGNNPVYGGLGTIFRKGCDIAIMYDPSFGHDRIRKFTIAGQGLAVAGILPHFETLEPGWGGRQCIIGSPRRGSIVSAQTVLESAVNLL